MRAEWKKNNPLRVQAHRLNVLQRNATIVVEEAERRGGMCETPKCKNRGMVWHHRKGEKKSFTIKNGRLLVGVKCLLFELAKCDLICANCHHLIHFGKPKWWR